VSLARDTGGRWMLRAGVGRVREQSAVAGHGQPSCIRLARALENRTRSKVFEAERGSVS
jgi:hypothetical protein